MTWRQGIDNGCAVIEHCYRPIALQTFVCFHPPVDLVAMLHLSIAQGVAFDPSLFVHELDIIEDARAKLDAPGLRNAGAITLPTDDDLLCPGGFHTPHSHDPHQGKKTTQPSVEPHKSLL